MQGQKLAGRYQITSRLGGGAFGATFLAIDTLRPGNPQCVVKQFKPRATDPYTLQEGKRLFDQEAKILETLGHHNQIPQLLAHFEENQEFYLVQEFIEGDDLSQELPPISKQLSEKEVIKLLQEILEVLAFVHQRNVIHRDIKPSNIRRRKSDDKIVLIDFGAVKEVKGLEVNQQGQTVPTVAIGTPGYMASEQANRNPKFSSDVYSVGIIGIQALTGINPAPPSSQHVGGLPTDTRTGEIVWRLRVKVSPKLANIIDKMVRYHFPGRYQTADEALQALLGLTKSKNRSLAQKIALTLGFFAVLFSISIAIPQVRQILGGLTANSPSADTSLLFYENSNYGIRMKYPKTWNKQDIGTYGDVAKFLSPTKTNSNTFPAELTIEVEHFKQPTSLAQYTNSKVNDITQYLTNARIDDSRTTTLAHLPAHEVIYSGKQEQYNLKRKAVWLLKNNKAYILTYTAQESQYDDYLNTAQDMINSLEIR